MLAWSGEVEEGPLLGLGSSLLTPGLEVFGGANLSEFVKAEAQFLLLLL